LNIEQLYAVLERIEQMTPQLAEALSVPWKNEVNYVRLLQEAHQRQSELINQMASEQLSPPRRPGEILAGVNAPPPVHRDAPNDPRQRDLTPRTAAGTAGMRSGTKASTGTTACVSSSVALSSLMTRLGTVIASCRQSRLPMSLVLVQLDDFENLTARYGQRPVAKLVQDIRSLIHDASEAYDNVAIEAVSACRLSLILTDADRQQAIAVARQVLDGVRNWSDATPPGSRPLSVSIGLASLSMPPRNFQAADLLQAAERCLNGAGLSGGNSVKSIEIC
jgi:GGDEF domain-containing protein